MIQKKDLRELVLRAPFKLKQKFSPAWKMKNFSRQRALSGQNTDLIILKMTCSTKVKIDMGITITICLIKTPALIMIQSLIYS